MAAIKELLGEQLYAQVMEKLGTQEIFLHDKGQKVIVDDGNLIPKHRLDEVIVQRDTFKAQAEKADRDLKDLGKLSKGNEELTAEIDRIKTERVSDKVKAEGEILTVRKSFAVKEGLIKAGVNDPEAVDLLAMKFGEVELNNDGTVKRFDDLLKPIKENKAFAGMFGETKIAGQRHGEGDPPANGQFLTREQIKGMNQKEVDANLDHVIKSVEHLGKSERTN